MCVYIQLLHTIPIFNALLCSTSHWGLWCHIALTNVNVVFLLLLLFLFPTCGTRHIYVYICRLSWQSLANISESTGCFMMLVAMVTSRNQTKGETGRGGGAPMQVGDCPCALCWILLTGLYVYGCRTHWAGTESFWVNLSYLIFSTLKYFNFFTSNQQSFQISLT